MCGEFVSAKVKNFEGAPLPSAITMSGAKSVDLLDSVATIPHGYTDLCEPSANPIGHPPFLLVQPNRRHIRLTEPAVHT